MNGFRISSAAMRDLLDSPAARAGVEAEAARIVARARSLASSVSPRLAQSIVATVVTSDPDGAYIDIGYDKNQPGWVLWFHEIGTSKHPATPHLRPAAGIGS